jgi:hypothetical protein
VWLSMAVLATVFLVSKNRSKEIQKENQPL